MTAGVPARISKEGRPQHLSQTVVSAVAAALGVDPVDLDTPLYDVLDPDALDRLFDGVGRRGSIEFTFCGCWVRAEASGDVRVDPSPANGITGSPVEPAAVD